MTDYREGFTSGYDAGYRQARKEVIAWLSFQQMIMTKPGWENHKRVLEFPRETPRTEALLAALEGRTSA